MPELVVELGREARKSRHCRADILRRIRGVKAGAETFAVLLTSEEQIRAAEQAQAGGRANIPTGVIVAGTSANTDGVGIWKT